MERPLDSVEWATMYTYFAQIETFKSRIDELTEEEVVVMKWMERVANALKERSQ